MRAIIRGKYSYTKQKPDPISLRPIQTTAKQHLVPTMFLRQATTIIFSMPVAGEINMNIPDRRLTVRRHPSSRERIT